MSVDESSGAMYTFNGSSTVSIYTRTSNIQITSSTLTYDTVSNPIDSVVYGQVVHDKHMALIVTKSGQDPLYFQVQKYFSGSPPDNYQGGVIEEYLGYNASQSIYNIDWVHKSLPQPTLYIVNSIPHRVDVVKFDITVGFLTKTNIWTSDVPGETFHNVKMIKWSSFPEGSYVFYSQTLGG